MYVCLYLNCVEEAHTYQQFVAFHLPEINNVLETHTRQKSKAELFCIFNATTGDDLLVTYTKESMP